MTEREKEDAYAYVLLKIDEVHPGRSFQLDKKCAYVIFDLNQDLSTPSTLPGKTDTAQASADSAEIARLRQEITDLGGTP